VYRCATWEKSRERLQYYRRREPERSVLYQLVYHGRDELPRVWGERFQPEYGVLRDEVLTTLDEYLNCGILVHGAARVHCDTCKHSLLVAFSCKKRGVCPSCGAKRAVKFAEHLYENVLEEVPNRHVVFTIPKRLRGYFRYDRKLGSVLFQAAWQSLVATLGTFDALAAAVLTIQTAGEALNFHPHLHGCLADGLFYSNGKFQRFAFIDQAALIAAFATRVLSALCDKELIRDEDVAQIMSQKHSGFNVWLGDPFQDSESDRFVARYIERGPVSLEKLSIQDDIITYSTKDEVAHEFDALEFLALLSSHVPKPYESMTRYYGWYSCRARGERKKKLAAKLETQEPEPARQPSPTWAQCIKRIFEIDPLECPKCKGKMRIVAFLQNEAEIHKIMNSLGIPKFSPPPKLPRAPPQWPELFDDQNSWD
jgi:uncharacterized Zn finger protein (UPF0148 family)